MCQTSSLISQTKAGEFDLSEFRSFVPMNKTLLLLDVTRTYQVTDSPFELGGDTVQEPLRRMRKKRWSSYCISSALAVRKYNCTNAKIYRYVQHTRPWWRLTFDQILMNNTLDDRKKESQKERKTKLIFDFISSVLYNLCKSLQLCKNRICRD